MLVMKKKMSFLCRDLPVASRRTVAQDGGTRLSSSHCLRVCQIMLRHVIAAAVLAASVCHAYEAAGALAMQGPRLDYNPSAHSMHQSHAELFFLERHRRYPPSQYDTMPQASLSVDFDPKVQWALTVIDYGSKY